MTTEFNMLLDAYKNNNLTLYLGAGVSMGSGLQSWDALVLAMYFKMISGQPVGQGRLFPNYISRSPSGNLITCRNLWSSLLARFVVTYNYDSLLESILEYEGIPHQPIWTSNIQLQVSRIPIYHVHGYVPFDKRKGSTPKEIVFTEDQYNRVANDPYSWTNLVQIHSISSRIGLRIGLSLSDRNMRRLFDAARSTPIETHNFALLKRPQWH